MSTLQIMYRCFICTNEFQMGPDAYRGKYVRRYDITVCEICWKGNWDGWAPHCESRLIAHLKEKGLPIPDRNENGWLPRD